MRGISALFPPPLFYSLICLLLGTRPGFIIAYSAPLRYTPLQTTLTFIGNLLSFQVDVLIQRALNFQTCRGESMFNQFLKYGHGSQGASLHTDGNLRKKAAFNLIVFGTARRIMAYVNLQSGFQRKVRQILLEHPSIVTVTAAAISGEQKPSGILFRL